ncbi:cytochrome c oxidase assembly protein [Spirillospora sp. CA-255316]
MHPHNGHDGAHVWGTWTQAVPLLVLSGVLVGGYVWAAARTRTTSRPWDNRRVVSWISGCAVVAVAVSPLPGMHGDPRGHMLQHLLLGMIAPLGLVLGSPVLLLLRTTAPSARRAVAGLLRSRALRVLGHPVTAAVLSTGGLAVILLTPLYTAAEHHPVLHHGLHLHYLAAGCLFTWSIAGPDPAPHRPGPALRVAVLIVAAAAHAVLAKYVYAHAGTLPLTGHHDPEAVRDAARLMYYGGDIAELLLATALFAAWYGRRSRIRTASAIPTVE